MTDPATPTKPVDPRAVIGGVVSLVSIVCATVLAAFEGDLTIAASAATLATTALGYVFGLYSEPRD